MPSAYVYNVNDAVGTAPLSTGTTNNQILANSLDVTLPAGAGLVTGNNYWLCVGAVLDLGPRATGRPNPVQLRAHNANVYTFTF